MGRWYVTDTQSTIIAIVCAGLAAFVVLTVLLAVYVFTDRIMNMRKLEKLADRIFAKHRETSKMSNTQETEQSPITFRFQISNIIERNGYRAQIIINRTDVEIEGEVDGHAFNFHASDWWAFGVSKDKLSDGQRLDVCTNKQVTDEHPIAQAVTGPYAFVLRENPGAFMTYDEAMKTVEDCIAKFRASVQTSQEALREAAAIEG